MLLLLYKKEIWSNFKKSMKLRYFLLIFLVYSILTACECLNIMACIFIASFLKETVSNCTISKFKTAHWNLHMPTTSLHKNTKSDYVILEEMVHFNTFQSGRRQPLVWDRNCWTNNSHDTCTLTQFHTLISPPLFHPQATGVWGSAWTKSEIRKPFLPDNSCICLVLLGADTSTAGFHLCCT